MGIFGNLLGGVGGFLAGGPLGSAIGSAIGGAIDNSRSKRDAADANSQQLFLNEQNYQRQKEFAQMGIRWKVEDAKAAGLHPLYALGGSGATYTPSAVSLMTPSAPDYSAMGQNVARAAAAGSSESENDLLQLQKDRLRAEIGKIEAETRKLNAWPWEQSGIGGAQAFPLVGQRPIGLPGDIQPWQVRELGQDTKTRAGASPDGIPIGAYNAGYSGRVNPKPADQPSRHPEESHRNPAVLPGYTMMETGPGFYRLMPSGNDPWETWAELPWYEKARIIHMSSGNAPSRWDYYKGYLSSEWGGNYPRFRQNPPPRPSSGGFSNWMLFPRP